GVQTCALPISKRKGIPPAVAPPSGFMSAGRRRSRSFGGRCAFPRLFIPRELTADESRRSASFGERGGRRIRRIGRGGCEDAAAGSVRIWNGDRRGKASPAGRGWGRRFSPGGNIHFL